MGDDKDAFGFGKFVPGFDFLSNLAKGSAPGMAPLPNLSSWVAPTLDVKELDKRIEELKAVMFWLDQNGKALQATIQALEVQKMTLATLQGMNLSMGQMAEAFTFKPDAFSAAAAPAPATKAKPEPEPEPDEAAGSQAGQAASAGVVDPLQWWGSLTQQFQQIAATAMQDVAEQAAKATAPMTQAPAAAPKKAAARRAAPATGKTPARKATKGAAKKAGRAPARKATGRKGTAA